MTNPRTNTEAGEQALPAKVRQPHGGALYAGGVPGHRGGGGRPPSAVRRLCRETFEEFIPKLREIITGEESSAADVTRAIDLLGKYGLGTQIGIVDDEGTTATGIIALPGLEMHALQREVHGENGSRPAPPAPEIQYVEKTVDVLQRRDRDDPPRQFP
jgi:hypothetical protein